MRGRQARWVARDEPYCGRISIELVNRDQKSQRHHAVKGELGRGRVSTAVERSNRTSSVTSALFRRLPFPTPLLSPACASCMRAPETTAAARRRKHAALVLSPKQIPIVAGGLKGIEGCTGALFLLSISLSLSVSGFTGSTKPLFDPATELTPLFHSPSFDIANLGGIAKILAFENGTKTESLLRSD